MAVFVLDKCKKPLMPCSEKRARKLLTKRRAVVHRRTPFTIRLKDRVGGNTQPLRLKIDPGSRVTGLALVREAHNASVVLWLGELTHRGASISKAMAQRRALRRRRRSTRRYRAPRFLNRPKPRGWLAPSLQHRVNTTMAWVNKLRRFAPVTGLAQELVCFDMQAMQTPGIAGAEYQQGTLAGYEIREYLLAKWDRQCAYCDARDVPLQIDHIHPRARGGSNRVSNLTLSCQSCNQTKGSRPIEAFLAGDPLRLQRIQSHTKRPLREAAAVNATRWALYQRLKATNRPVEVGNGGRTKSNRCQLAIPKTHALDAACVGQVTDLRDWRRPTLAIRAMGRGAYKRTRLTQHGLPRGYLMRKKQVHGFQTGDRVRAAVPTGKKAGIHIGRCAVRATGRFNIQTANGAVQGISHRYCRLIQRADGYDYHHTPKIAPTQREAARTGAS